MVTQVSDIENRATQNLRNSKVRISATQLKAADPGSGSRLRGALLWTLIATSFAFVVVQLDVTIVNVALPQISASLHSGVTGLQWVVDAYTLSFAVLLIAAGVLGDRFGSRRAYLAGFFVFTAASAACGMAPNILTLIIARAAQGMGAALLVPSSLALLNHSAGANAKMRARMVGLWTAAGGVSIAAGPIVGGLLLGPLGWRSIFLVNLPVGVLGAFLTLRYVPRDGQTHSGHSLDLPGQLLAMLTLTGLTGAVIELRPLGLTHPVVLGGFVLAFISGVAFVFVEARSAAPMLPLRFFTTPNFSPAVGFGIIVNLTYYGVIFVLSLYLQQARGYTALQAGLAYLPLTSTFIISNLISGWMVGRTGSRAPMALGALIGATGYALLWTLGPKTPFIVMMPAFLLIPAGMGLGVPAMTTAILSSVERTRSGTASAVLNTARQAGAAIGVAAFGAMVGGSKAEIITGMHASAAISSSLLVLAALLAYLGIHRRQIH
jgi:MFS transporter, DHA2 family, methylenomycin A resistance protein